MIDLHFHVLPGIDDGPATIEESLELARAAALAGTRTIVATPHVSRRYPNESHVIARGVQELNARLTLERADVRVVPGAEISLTRVAGIPLDELSALGLGKGPWLLIEPPFGASATGLEEVLFRLDQTPHRILLAHPERSPVFHRDPEMLRSLVRAGALTSITAASLVGGFGRTAKRFTSWMVREELVHNVSSDAHNLSSRPPEIAWELEQAGLSRLSDWLTLEVPGAILAGEDVPRRPPISFHAPEAPVWRRWQARSRRAA